MRSPAVVIILSACAIAQSAACLPGTRGSGNSTRQQRKVEAFREVAVSGAFSIEIRVGPKHEIELSGDDNIVPLVTAAVHGQRLTLRTKDAISPTLPLRATIVAPDIRYIGASGASKITATGFDNPQLRVDISGAGSLRLSGRTAQLELELSGAGAVNARHLKARRVSVEASGAGSIKVHADQDLKVDLSGVGSVIYYGNPKRVRQDVSGLGRVKKG